MELGFLTASTFPDLSPDCLLGAEALRKRGVKVTPVIWDETAPEKLQEFDRVVVRSIWDYQYKLPQFEKWLSELVRLDIRTLNPPGLMQWNLSKRYLTELQAEHDIPIVPTTWIEQNSANFSSQLACLSWERLIAKPEISASANLTFDLRRTQTSEIESAVREIQKRSAVMIQPFCESILTVGETSLVYFSDGNSPRLSHVISKRPKSGDFRIQHEHGGIYERIEPSRGLLALGDRAVSTLEPGWLFARVDIVNCDGQLCLGELEAIEPQLYFRWAPEAAETFADCVVQRS